LSEFFNKAVSVKVFIPLLLLLGIVLPIVTHKFWVNNIIPPAENGLEISQLIRRVKTELEAANTAANQNHEAALFQAKTFDLELTFVVEASTSTEGKTDYRLVAVDNTLEAKSERTQKITIHMDVVQPERVVKPVGVSAPNRDGGVKVVGIVPPKKREDKCLCEDTDQH
jgi:hypothetical protein